MGSSHVVEQLSFSLFLSILTFDFDLILGSFSAFWGPNGLFLGLRKGSKTVLGSPHVVEQFSFSMLPSILTFDFGLIFGSFSFLLFEALIGCFLGWDRVQKLFWGLLIETKNFCFQSIALFQLYHVVLSSCGGVGGGWVDGGGGSQ